MSPDQQSEWNRTEVDYPRGSTIAAEFAARASLTPHAIALVAGDRELSYSELDARSNQLARHLQRLGVKPEALAGILLGRSEHLLIGILAVLKAGGAYVPLDPGHPAARIATVLEDSGTAVVLASSETRVHLPRELSGIVVLDVEDPAITRESSHPLGSAAAAHNLAYVIYTSGSTGKPKGVMVENQNVINFFAGMDRVIGSEPGVWLAVTSIAFDISVLELLWTLTRGFTIVIHNDRAGESIGAQIVRHKVTHLQMTPSLARMLAFDRAAIAALAGLRKLLLGGEGLPPSLIPQLRTAFTGDLHNMYGPTETTVWSTTHRVAAAADSIPIGRPIANTQVFLLDEQMQQVPFGETGELYIGGDGVARGYWNRPELTAERFLFLLSISPRRLYRTGDLARMLPDGTLDFAGRVDDQIKLRGYRIEPAEIETALEQCAGVEQAIVLAREDRVGDQRLVAYLVSTPSGAEAVDTLRGALSAKLPEPMIPSSFVFLSSLPLTENGKVNRRALSVLPPPALSAPRTVPHQNEVLSEIERVVAQAWQQALGISAVGLNDNFFELGAHSLTIAEVQSRLQRALDREIPIVDLFQYSTVRSLSRHLAGAEPSVQAAAIADRAQRRKLARERS